jgi:AcrR family transcriptional regulator
VFKQARAAETHAALLEAAEKVFARLGFDGAQTPEIAAQAGVSTGTFYWYFEDKRQCFVEMIARNLDRAYADVSARLEPALFRSGDVEAVIDAAIEVLFAHVTRDRDLERVYMQMSLKDAEVAQLRADFEKKGLALLTGLIESIIPREIVPHPQAAALVVECASLEVASERAGLRPRLGPTVSDRDVKLALRTMLHRYLFPTETSAPSARSARSTRRR